MDDLIRASDLTSTMAKIKVLNERLTSISAELAEWKIYVAVEVTGNGALKVSVAKRNGTGFIHEVDPQIVAKYSDDPETLISSIVDTAYERLLHDPIRNALTAPITRAMKNATRIKNESKSSNMAEE